MNQRLVRFKDNEVYDVLYAILGGSEMGDRSVTAYEALKKLAAVGTPGERLGRWQSYVMLEKDGPKEVTLLESEHDVVLKALRDWKPKVFDVGLQAKAIALIENAEKV